MLLLSIIWKVSYLLFRLLNFCEVFFRRTFCKCKITVFRCLGWKPPYINGLSHVYGYIYTTVHTIKLVQVLIKVIKTIVFSNNQLQDNRFVVIYVGVMVYTLYLSSNP